MAEAGTLKEIGTLQEVTGPRVLGVLPASVVAEQPKVIGTLPKRDYVQEALESYEEAEVLRKHHPSELPPEFAPKPPMYDIFGITPDPEALQEAEMERRKTRLELLKSPKALAAIEGIGRAIPEGLKEGEVPTVEEVYDRPKTVGEHVIGGVAQLGAEAPLFLAAGGIAGATVPRYLGKKLAGKMLAGAAKSGVMGTAYHAMKNFGDQMFDDEEFDWGLLGKDAAEGFILWGTLGALGPPAGKAFRGVARTVSPRLARFGKLKMRAQNSGLHATITEPLEEFGGKSMLELGAPGGLKWRFGDVTTANNFLKQVEREGVEKLVAGKNWAAMGKALKRATARLEASMMKDPRSMGRMGAAFYDRIFGNIIYQARRIEEAVMGPRALRNLRDQAFKLGLSGKERTAWIGKQMQARSSLRLYTNLIFPVMEASRLAGNSSFQFGRYLQRRIFEPIRRIAEAKGETPEAVAAQITEWLEAVGHREAINPKTIISSINMWRAAVSKDPFSLAQIVDRIQRFTLSRGMSKTAERKLLRMVMGGDELTVSKVNKAMGKSIRAARAKAIKGRPLAERVEQIHGFTKDQIDVAKRSRRAFDHLFRAGGVDPIDYMQWYVPMRNAEGFLPWNQAQKLLQKSTSRFAFPRAKFFAEMHREGNIFVPETDVRRLLSKYNWGAFRAKHLNDVVNDAQKIVDKINPGPVRERFQAFLRDTIVGMDNRTQAAVFGALSDATGGGLPMPVVEDMVQTAMATVYGSTMGIRPWLIIRNLLQPSQTVLPLTGSRALMRAYKDAGAFRLIRNKAGKIVSFGKLWDDFLEQGVHMRKGGGLPFGEEIMRAMDVASTEAPLTGSGWAGFRSFLGFVRAVSNRTTQGYQFADTTNRFVSYRAALHRIEQGLAKKGVLDSFAKKAYSMAKKLPNKPIRGKITAKQIATGRLVAITELTESAQMDRLFAATGLRNMFPETVNNRLGKRALAELLFLGPTSKTGVVDLYLMKSPRAVKNIIKEAFMGKQGSLAAELGNVMKYPGGPEEVWAAFKDSLAKRFGRLLVADTQWVYNRMVQPAYLQRRAFGMFMTWPANIIDFVRRHALEIGSPAEKAKKVATVMGVLGGTYKALEQVGINPSYLWKAFTPPAGGPFFQPILDVLQVSRYVSGVEKTLAWERLKDLPESMVRLVAPGESYLRSLYRTAKGEKKVLPGILGASEAKGDKSLYVGKRGVKAAEPLNEAVISELESLLSTVRTAPTDSARLAARETLQRRLDSLFGHQFVEPEQLAERVIGAKRSKTIKSLQK